MKRPTVTDEMIRAAILEVAPSVAGSDASEIEIENVADSIGRVYRHHMDGYELAKALDKWEGWDTTREDCDELDRIDMLVDRRQREAEKAWFAANPVEPPHPVGTTITRGVITGVYGHQPAYYLVKEHGCTQEGRSLLIRFEDARVPA